MAYIAISALMRSRDAADALYDTVKERAAPEHLHIVDGGKVIAEVEPKDAARVAEVFAAAVAEV
jgi:hypothetical protein